MLGMLMVGLLGSECSPSGGEKVDSGSGCVSDVAEQECPSDYGGYYCDGCGQNWFCGEREDWWRTDLSCDCVTEAGTRDSAPECNTIDR